MNNSPSNIFQPLLWVERYHQNHQGLLVTTGMNGLNKKSYSWTLENFVLQYCHGHHIFFIAFGFQVDQSFIYLAKIYIHCHYKDKLFMFTPEYWVHVFVNVWYTNIFKLVKMWPHFYYDGLNFDHTVQCLVSSIWCRNTVIWF